MLCPSASKQKPREQVIVQPCAAGKESQTGGIISRSRGKAARTCFSLWKIYHNGGYAIRRQSEERKEKHKMLIRLVVAADGRHPVRYSTPRSFAGTVLSSHNRLFHTDLRIAISQYMVLLRAKPQTRQSSYIISSLTARTTP
jgi:hypothetical protein